MQYTLKKSLGQHFLNDAQVCKDIQAVLLAQPIEQLLEVGPGAGALTKYIQDIPKQSFKAIELDREKVAFLSSEYPELKDKLILADILEAALPFENDFVVVGNFPYNISTQIVFKILEWKDQVPMAFYDVTYLFDVPPTAFTPPPKVMSGVIRLTRKDNFPKFVSEKLFYHIVKMAFGQRRKMLRNPLKPYFSAAQLQDPLFTKRAENLTYDDYAALTFKMHIE
jgi:16S rRNA (adenine1518-N6/adenine1519-N6)-dimethyltransferase